MKVVTPRMSDLATVVLRYLTTAGRAQYEDGQCITPTFDQAVAAARELKALLSDDAPTTTTTEIRHYCICGATFIYSADAYRHHREGTGMLHTLSSTPWP